MAPQLHWLRPEDPPNHFPDADDALEEPDGLLAIGGDLSIPRLVAAYRRGIFPWYQDGQPVMWWSPDPRAVLFPAELHVSRSLYRTLRRNRFAVSCDAAFAAVIQGCAAQRADTGTWITTAMQRAYCDLHTAGHAHSIEVWQHDELVGGVYGVSIGRVFFGESMFSRRSDASKVALVRLVALCRALGVRLIDCQMKTAHMTRMGSRQLPRAEFNALLNNLAGWPAPAGWAQPRTGCAEFASRTP